MLFLRWSQAPRLIVCQIKIQQRANPSEHDRRDHPEDPPDDPAIARVERPGRMAVLRDVMAQPMDPMRCGLQNWGERLLRIHGRRMVRFHRFLPSSHDVASPAMAVVRSVGRGATKNPAGAIDRTAGPP
jgi:hypothetical protein